MTAETHEACYDVNANYCSHNYYHSHQFLEQCNDIESHLVMNQSTWSLRTTGCADDPLHTVLQREWSGS